MSPIAFYILSAVAAAGEPNASYTTCEPASADPHVHIIAADDDDLKLTAAIAAIANATASRSVTKLQLATTLAFTDPDPLWIPEPGTELRTALETYLADWLLETINAGLVDAETSLVGVQSVEIDSIEQTRMEGHHEQLYYAFINTVLTVELLAADDACTSSVVSVEQLRHGNSCSGSADTIADAMTAASSALQDALRDDDRALAFEEGLEEALLSFTESSSEKRQGRSQGNSVSWNGELRVDDEFELMVDGTRLSLRAVNELRQELQLVEEMRLEWLRRRGGDSGDEEE